MTMDECKQVIKACTFRKFCVDTRKANIEIELIYFIKRELYKD